MRTFRCSALIGLADLMGMIRTAADDPDFDHEIWSIYDAERLESLARQIRAGYAQRTDPIADPPAAPFASAVWARKPVVPGYDPNKPSHLGGD